MRHLALGALVVFLGCSAGSVTATPPGDVAMSVSDAVWWRVEGTGDPGTDGSVLVLLSTGGNLCESLTVDTFAANQELFALQAFSGTSDSGAAKGSYPAGATSGPHATARRYSAPAGCTPPVGHEALATGSLELDDVSDGSTLHGTLTGTLDDGTQVTVDFSASSCDAGGAEMNGLASALKFHSCG